VRGGDPESDWGARPAPSTSAASWSFAGMKWLYRRSSITGSWPRRPAAALHVDAGGEQLRGGEVAEVVQPDLRLDAGGRHARADPPEPRRHPVGASAGGRRGRGRHEPGRPLPLGQRALDEHAAVAAEQLDGVGPERDHPGGLRLRVLHHQAVDAVRHGAADHQLATSKVNVVPANAHELAVPAPEAASRRSPRTEGGVVGVGGVEEVPGDLGRRR